MSAFRYAIDPQAIQSRSVCGLRAGSFSRTPKMPHTWASIMLIWFLSCGAPNATAQEETRILQLKYQTHLDTAVDRGLAYLAEQQIDEKAGRPELVGSFREAAAPGNTGVTSLAVMAFLARGHLPGRGRYGSTINKGIDYLLEQQLENGLLISGHRAGRTTGLMYEHSIAALLLSEVSGMVDAGRQEKIDQVLPKALLVLLQAQKVPKAENNSGGWRYTPGTTDSDLSLTGWSIMALRAARMNGAAIPDEHIESAVEYILNCRKPDGGFAYMPFQPNSSTSMTGIGLLCLELCGEHGSAELNEAGNYILSRPPRMTDGNGRAQKFRYYSFYYCGQAMFQLGGRYWQQFAPEMYDALLEDQNADGSWSYPDGTLKYNTSYPTSLAVLTLTVSARQLPIYQRDE